MSDPIADILNGNYATNISPKRVRQLIDEAIAALPPASETEIAYDAVLTQTSTNAPTVVSSRNNLGESVNITYNSTGEYYLTKTTPFDITKTQLFIGNSYMGAGTLGVNYMMVDDNGVIVISTRNQFGNPVNDRLHRTAIRIVILP
jgi:hypothetical protein